MRLENLQELESDTWWRLPWPAADENWRAWRSGLGHIVLESPELCSQPDSQTCLHALQLGLMAPWQLPARLALREQSLHLQVAWKTEAPPEEVERALPADLQVTQNLLAQWAQEEPQPAPEQDEVSAPEPQALQAIRAIMVLLEQDPELGPLSELDDDTAELVIAGSDDDELLILMRPLPSGPQAYQVAVMLPQILLPVDEPARLDSLRQHLQRNDAVQIGPQLQWVADAGGQQLFLQGLFDPQTGNLEDLRLLLARLLALDAELSGEGSAPSAAYLDHLHLHLSAIRG
jgi:hypothetical protein